MTFIPKEKWCQKESGAGGRVAVQSASTLEEPLKNLPLSAEVINGLIQFLGVSG